MKVTFRKNETVYHFCSVQPGQLFAIEFLYEGVANIKVYMKILLEVTNNRYNSVLLTDTSSSQDSGTLCFISDLDTVIPVDECEFIITLRS